MQAVEDLGVQGAVQRIAGGEGKGLGRVVESLAGPGSKEHSFHTASGEPSERQDEIRG